MTKAARWADPSAVKQVFGNAYILHDGRVVFDIGDNKYRLVAWVTHTHSGWWCPASTVLVKSSKRPAQALHRYRCRAGCVSSHLALTTAGLPHPGHYSPSGQQCWRTKAKHLASSIRSERVTKSGAAMDARTPRSKTRGPSSCRFRHIRSSSEPPAISLQASTPEPDMSHSSKQFSKGANRTPWQTSPHCATIRANPLVNRNPNAIPLGSVPWPAKTPSGGRVRPACGGGSR